MTQNEVVDVSRREALRSALAQWSSNPQLAIETLRPLANQGDPDATLLLTYLLFQQGRPQEAAEFVVAAVRNGASFLIPQLLGNLPNLPNRPAVLDAIRPHLEAGWPMDPMGHVQQLAQFGDSDAALALLSAARSWPVGVHAARDQWEAHIAAIDASRPAILEAQTLTKAAAESAQATIAAHEAHIAAEHERVKKLVSQADDLVHNVASNELARQYADQAEKVERTANRYTVGAMLVSGVAIAASIFIAVLVLRGSTTPGAALSKFALTLPLVAFAAYLGGLAASHRRMAWHWRHVELQIKTAEPFIATLDDSERNALLAVLALRFFPGQSQDPVRHDAGDSATSVDLTGMVSSLLSSRSK